MRYLPTHQWLTLPIGNRLHALSMLYLSKCTDKKFSKTDLFKLKNFFGTKTDSEIAACYDFLYGLSERKLLSLTELFKEAEIYRVQRIKEYDKSLQPVTNQSSEELSIEEIMKIISEW